MATTTIFQKVGCDERSGKGNSHRTTPMVMDVLPWPNGCGFSGADNWWRDALGQSERERLNNLIGLALLDPTICEQLVAKRDPALFTTFGLSARTQDWLSTVGAANLTELAQAIMAASNLFSFDAGSVEAA